MKYLKKILLVTTFIITSLGFTSFSANAVLITQDIEVSEPGSEFTLGTVSIDIPDADLNNGLVSVFGFVELNLLGVPDFTVFDFEAVVDGDNVFAGIEFMTFDVEEVGFDFWNYQLIIDEFNPAFNFLDIFDSAGDPIFFTDQVGFGKATFVSEPAMIALFASALLMMRIRRRQL